MRLEIEAGSCQVWILNVFLQNNGNSLWHWLGVAVPRPRLWVMWRMDSKTVSLILLYIICTWVSFLGSSSMSSLTSFASPPTPPPQCTETELSWFKWAGEGPSCEPWGEPTEVSAPIYFLTPSPVLSTLSALHFLSNHFLRKTLSFFTSRSKFNYVLRRTWCLGVSF